MRVPTPVLFEPLKPHQIVDLDVADPGPGEVRVRMTASGVCHSCLYVMDGLLPRAPMPIVLGDEGAGHVESVGPNVTSVTPGDPVIVSWAPGCGECPTCWRGAPALCRNTAAFGRTADGGTRFQFNGADVAHYGPATNAPLCVLPARAVVRIDPRMPLDLAATIGCAVTTGSGAVRTTARVRLGDAVVVVGCGGIGSTVLHAAALAGAHPIVAVDVAASKFDMLRSYGATHCIDPANSDAVAEIIDVTGGGADASFLTTSAERGFDTAVKCLGPRGTCVLIAGFPDGRTLTFDPGHLLNGERRIITSKYGSANPPADFPELVSLYLAGRLRLAEMITDRWRMDQVDEAYDALRSGRTTRGLIVFD